MAILDFIKPEKVIMLDSSKDHGVFEFRPLEPGYGITVGMLFVACLSVRSRALLSALLRSMVLIMNLLLSLVLSPT